MIVSYDYAGRSGIVNGLNDSRVAFATNTLREATFFKGQLGQPLLFREALAALYEVVVSDYQYRPRDRLEFRAWLEEQDRKFLASLGMKSQKARERMEKLEARLAELDEAKRVRLQPFYRARKAFFEYVYENEYELSLLLDPVITVHPDEISFEAFSRDESTYGRLAARFELFQTVDAFECGTTNIDFSTRLHGELERMRSYRSTSFQIDPSGFSVACDGQAAHKEKKIELPETWVMGFLQVQSTMSMGLTRLRLAAVDLFNICRFLRRHKTRVSPRALRYELEPGKRGRVVVEPYNHVIELTGMAPFEGLKPLSVRTWGRNRLQVIRRLLPICRSIDIYLAGYGMPSFYVFDLGPITFTLGLSGWTDNDWSGGAKFDLLTRRLEVSSPELTQVYESLRKVRRTTDSELGSTVGLGVEKTRSALSFLCQVGRAMYDLGGRVYRHRDLFSEPFSAKEAAAAVQKMAEEANPQQKAAGEIFKQEQVRIIARRPVTTGYKLSGSAKGDDGQRVRPLLHVDRESRIIEASCTCAFYKKAKLTQGPCEHILALRLAHMSRLEAEDKGG